MFKNNTAFLWDWLYGQFAEKETEFVSKIYTEKSGKGIGKVLDIGCGTGRFLIPLAEKGWKTFGVDVSNDMLSVLNRKALKRGVFVDTAEIEFKSFQTTERFDLILSFFSMIYVQSDKELKDFFLKVKKFLSPGGVFLVNFFNVYECWKPEGWEAKMSRTFKGGALKVDHHYSPIDTIQGVVKIEDFRMLNYNDQLYSDLSCRSVRYHTLSTIKTLLRLVGLKNITIYPDFNDKESLLDRKCIFTITIASIK